MLVPIAYAQSPLIIAHTDISSGTRGIFGGCLHLHVQSKFACMRTAKDLSSLGMYGDTPELSLLADAIRTTTSCKGLGVIKLLKLPTIDGILTFISLINTTSERLKSRNLFICRYFSFYEQLDFRAHFS